MIAIPKTTANMIESSFLLIFVMFYKKKNNKFLGEKKYKNSEFLIHKFAKKNERKKKRSNL